MTFTTAEFGPGRKFNTLDEYIIALEELEKLRRLRIVIQERGDIESTRITEDDISIESGVESIKIKAELKVTADRVDEVEKRMDEIDRKIQAMSETINKMFELIKQIDIKDEEVNKDGIPKGLILHCNTKGQEFRLKVEGDEYVIGQHRFNSLSGAAHAVSGNRRSGLAFWKLPNGRSVGEVQCHGKTETKN